MPGSQVRALVVGGAGFIGARLCARLLRSGYQLAVLDKRPADALQGIEVEYFQGDIRNLKDVQLALKDCSLVFNLAAEHRDDVTPRSLYEEVNIAGAENLCAAASDAKVRRIVFTSSVAVYGSQPMPMTEDAEHSYFNEYGRTKHLAELVYEQWLLRSDDNRLTILRPTVVFGPNNRGNVYNFLRQMKYGPFVMFGDGLNVKSMAHVDNIVAFLDFLAERQERHAVYNYADKPDLNMRELVAFVDETLGRKQKFRMGLPRFAGLAAGVIADAVSWTIRRPLPISAIRVQKFCAPSEIDASKAFATGFQPAIELRRGLAEMLHSV